MRLGVMNDPRLPPLNEARWAADNGFEFLDLTLEGPEASVEQIDLPALRSILDDAGMGVVGHTAWYLPFASPVARVRAAAIESVVDTFETFAALGAKRVNVHIAASSRPFGHPTRLRWNGESFAQLAERAEPYGLQIMVEHVPDDRVGTKDIERILNADQRLGFHLDVGHAHVGSERLESLLKTFGSRLAHVHMSDNKGRGDDHLPLGAGTIDWPKAIQLVRATGYDDTITLEVFTPDREYVLISARKLREWWSNQ